VGTSPRAAIAALAAALAVLSGCLSACDQSAGTRRQGVAPAAAATPPRPQPHRGVDLRVLVLSDGSPAVRAIIEQLTAEGVPATVIRLRDPGRPVITRSFLSRAAPGGGRGGNYEGIVLPQAEPRGLSGAELTALARYERRFRVRQVDAYTPPGPDVGTSAPVFAGPLTGDVSVTRAGAKAGFGYLRGSVPFSGGPAGPAPYAYLARSLPGQQVTPLLTAAVPGSAGSAELAWQYTAGGRQLLAIAFSYGYFQPQFRYLGPGIVDWLTRGVHLGYWRSYLTIDYDDVINADARWSMTGHCTPGVSVCPPGTPQTKLIRMTPADVRYAVAWQRRHHFIMEFLYNGGSSNRFMVSNIDPLLAAFRPVARRFYWVNHTYTHANLGCEQDFTVEPWRCVRRDGAIVWVGTGTVSYQILRNLSWARENGIPYEPGVLATGEYSGLRILPQQPVDNPSLVRVLGPDRVRWIVMEMRPVGAALGVPRHPIDVGYDVESVAEEVNQYNWFHVSKRDGGSGMCETSTTTACIRPLSPKTGWLSHIVPEQTSIVFAAMLANDPRPFYMHQSNLTGDRLGYPIMDRVLAAYRAVYRPTAPVVNLPVSGDGAALQRQQQWARALRDGTVTAWVQGRTVTVLGPAGTEVPVTVPAASSGLPRYGATRSGSLRLGRAPLKLTLAAPAFRR
jgi:hypothetical protein